MFSEGKWKIYDEEKENSWSEEDQIRPQARGE